MLWSMLPNTSLFHFLMGSLRFFILMCAGWFPINLHSFATILTKLGFMNQTSKDLKGFGPQSLFSQLINKGQWSEMNLFRPHNFKFLKNYSHSMSTKTLSIRLAELFLHQVNFLPSRGSSVISTLDS